MVDQLNRDESSRKVSVRSFAEELPGPSPLSALAQIAEQAEASATARPAVVDERLERFPELRGVEVPGGHTKPATPLQAAQRQAVADSEGDDVSKAAAKGLVNGFVGGLTPGAGVGDRFERFPELRDVTLAVSNTARFPELGADTEDEAAGKSTEDTDYGR